jgi:hypothetical protein
LRRKLFTWPTTRTAFLEYVVSVFFRSGKEEVVQVDASRIVAPMAHKQPLGNLATEEQPCRSVRVDSVGVNPELAVATTGETAGPKPAASRLVHLLPEAILRRNAPELAPTGRGAEPTFPRWECGEGASAIETDGGRLRLHRNLSFRCHGAGLFAQSRLLFVPKLYQESKAV